MGFPIDMIHPQAGVQSSKVGEGTKIGPFTVVEDGALIGSNCMIKPHCYIQTDVVIGNEVNIDTGVSLWNGLRIEDGVNIGPNVSFTADKMPDRPLEIVIRKGASIGGGAVIRSGTTIGECAQVEAGSVVTRSIPPKAIVVGNPARIVGYVETGRNALDGMGQAGKNRTVLDVGVSVTSVKGVTLHRFPLITDIRGNLVVGEFERTAPFVPKRFFLVHDVPSAEPRGEHAHRQCEQFLICVKGTCSIVADDGLKREEYILDRPNVGLYLPPMVWGIQYHFSHDAVLLVFASDYYDAADYIRDYDQFREAVADQWVQSTIPGATKGSRDVD